MSVTFSVYANEKFVMPEGFEYEYEIDPIYGKIPTNSNPLELNVSNGNYVRLMEILGLDHDDYCGTWKAEKLLRTKASIMFVLHSLGFMPELDGGVQMESSKGEHGCVIVDCGLREGYFTEKLETLLTLINKAIEVEGVVTFG